MLRSVWRVSSRLTTARVEKVRIISNGNISTVSWGKNSSFLSTNGGNALYFRNRNLKNFNIIGGIQMRSLFIQTEETPNPMSQKFLPGETVLKPEYGSTMHFKKSEKCGNSPLAKRMFRIPGVESVQFGEDYISVNKSEDVAWSQVKPEIFATLMDFFDQGKEAVTGPKDDESSEKSAVSLDDDEVVVLIKELLEERIRPMVQEDGGDIFYHSFNPETGVVVVKMAGSCEGCPSSTVTLKNGVENMLMHYIPEVTRVDQFIEEEELNERKLNWTPSP